MSIFVKVDLGMVDECPYCGEISAKALDVASIRNPFTHGTRIYIGASGHYECRECYREWIAHSLICTPTAILELIDDDEDDTVAE